MAKKTLQELTIKDNFMFAAAMMDPENCRDVLECILGIEIDHVNVSYEKSIVYHPEYKGIRLDVIARDENHTHFNVEMQVENREIFKRSRYYHGQIDMELLETGLDYEDLPDCYVIFVCDFDPVGAGKYRYTRRECFSEIPSYPYEDGSHTIFLSTKGRNESEVPKELVAFLKFVGATGAECEKNYGDALVSRLQTSIRRIKADREMGARYMLFEEMMKDEFKAGKAEGKIEYIMEVLADLGSVSDSIQEKLISVQDDQVLHDIFNLARRAGSLEEFQDQLDVLLESNK